MCRVIRGADTAGDSASASWGAVGLMARGKLGWGQIDAVLHLIPCCITHALNLQQQGVMKLMLCMINKLDSVARADHCSFAHDTRKTFLPCQ